MSLLNYPVAAHPFLWAEVKNLAKKRLFFRFLFALSAKRINFADVNLDAPRGANNHLIFLIHG